MNRRLVTSLLLICMGMAIGVIVGQLSKPPERITERITETVTKTITVLVTPAPKPTWLVVAPNDSGKLGLSWKFDDSSATYNVYRSTTSGKDYILIKSGLSSTSYLDSGLTDGQTYYYAVTSVKFGKESEKSNEVKATVTSNPKKFNEFLTIKDNFRGGRGNGCWGRIEDLNNDGNIDYLFQKGVLYIRAYNHKGNKIWEHNMNGPDPWSHDSWSMEPQPTVIWDIDQDGRNEVVCGNYYKNGKYHIVILDGESGNVEKEKELPDVGWADHMDWGSLANLRGTSKPQDFVVGYRSEDIIRGLRAYDNNLNLLWSWKDDRSVGDQGHRFTVGDVDYDGKDEVLVGEILLNSDGSVRWKQSRSSSHQDSSEIVELDGNTANGREVLIGYDSASKLVMLRGKTGNVVWEKSYGSSHCVHAIEPYELDTSNPRKEIFFYAKGQKKFYIVDGKDGSVIRSVVHAIPDSSEGSNEGNSICWQGKKEFEIITEINILDSNLNVISKRPEEHTTEMYLFQSGDIIGDYREEYFASDNDGNIHVYTNTDFNPTSKKTFWDKDWFRVWSKYVNADDF